ncbi:alpha-1-antiproteinase-like [Pelodytes ibericus]
MRCLIFLTLCAALLCTVVYSHHGGEHDHGDDKDNYQAGDHDHDHDHDHGHKHPKNHHHHHNHHGKGKDHHRSNETMACHKLSYSNFQFAVNLFKQLSAEQPKENIFFSPHSISSALALLSLGAKSNTRDQILEGLAFNTSQITVEEIHSGFQHLQRLLNDPNSELQLSSGNALFIDKQLKLAQKYLDDAKTFYHSEAFSTDFKSSDDAKNQINGYVNEKTNGKIPELFSSISPEAVLVLTSFIYFRGKWQQPFEVDQTVEGDFHVDEKTVVKVPMMHRTGMYNAWLGKNCTVVEIPYKGNASALFVLPEEGKLGEIVESFQKSTFMKWKKELRRQSLNLALPKFSISSTIDLEKELKNMGIQDLFSDAADLSGITEDAKLKVSKAVHKAAASIDEKGTEAAGATGFEIMPMMLPPTIQFIRPFIFVITDSPTKSVLFVGKVTNPLAV